MSPEPCDNYRTAPRRIGQPGPDRCLCGHPHAAHGQLILDMQPLVHEETVTGLTIQEQFEQFHRLNPWVLTAMERLTADYLAHGHRRIGVGMLTEVLRWQYGRATKGDEFKINNNFRSRYVRLMIERRPEWEEVFALRALRSA